MAGGKLIHGEVNASLIGSITNKLQVFIGCRRSKLPDDAELVIIRFQQLLDGHSMNRAQLLRLIPSEWNWNMGSVSDGQSLLQSLTASRISWLASRFGVREEWLAGQSNRVYDWPTGYKQPQRFATTLAKMGWIDKDLRMTILATNYRTGTNGPLKQFVILFSYPLPEQDNCEIIIDRHLCFDGGPMEWAHPPCRFDAMALARWFHCHANPRAWIPIVPAKSEDILAIADGTTFPGPLIPSELGGYDNFEDRILRFGHPATGEGESLAAIANLELDAVLKYVDQCGLAQILNNITEPSREQR